MTRRIAPPTDAIKRRSRQLAWLDLQTWFNLPPRMVPIPTLALSSPVPSGVSVGPGSLDGNLDHDQNTRDETAHPEDNVESGKSVAKDGDGDGSEELEKITVDGPVVPDVASGSPIGSVR